ncbi:uncharacterized protein LOC143689038 [Tamandua tetradactyla]|uniref:uncharacterized protein LOC143689038 n=1 Tax=Tamandua tetradactyla TaxID=48850 RepID=UPI00405443DF
MRAPPPPANGSSRGAVGRDGAMPRLPNRRRRSPRGDARRKVQMPFSRRHPKKGQNLNPKEGGLELRGLTNRNLELSRRQQSTRSSCRSLSQSHDARSSLIPKIPVQKGEEESEFTCRAELPSVLI